MEDGSATNGTLTATDADPGDTLTFTRVTDVANGSLTFMSSGSIVYTPNPDFCTTDTFTFTAQDQDSNISSVQTGTINVTCINDFPSLANTGFTINQDTVFVYDFASLINDVDSAYTGQTIQID